MLCVLIRIASEAILISTHNIGFCEEEKGFYEAKLSHMFFCCNNGDNSKILFVNSP